MSYLKKRVEKMEKRLNIGQEVVPRVICLISGDPDEAEQALPENVEHWLTYKEQLQKCPNTRLTILYAWDEVKAREKLQKAAKGQGNE